MAVPKTIYDPPFDISHLHKGEQNRIRYSGPNHEEEFRIGRGENPWPNPYPKGNVAHTRAEILWQQPSGFVPHPESSETGTGSPKPERKTANEPPNPEPPKPLSRMRRLLQTVRAADIAAHGYLMHRFPTTITGLDGMLGWLFGIFKHPIFGLIAALILAVLTLAGAVNIFVAISVGGAWLLSVVWVARSKAVRSLTILLRLIVVVGIAAVFAIASITFGRWALAKYQETKQQEKAVTQKPPQAPSLTAMPAQTPAPSPSPPVSQDAQRPASASRRSKAQEARRRKEKALRILHSP